MYSSYNNLQEDQYQRQHFQSLDQQYPQSKPTDHFNEYVAGQPIQPQYQQRQLQSFDDQFVMHNQQMNMNMGLQDQQHQFINRRHTTQSSVQKVLPQTPQNHISVSVSFEKIDQMFEQEPPIVPYKRKISRSRSRGNIESNQPTFAQNLAQKYQQQKKSGSVRARSRSMSSDRHTQEIQQRQPGQMMKQISLVDNEDEPQEEESDEDDLASQLEEVMMQYEQASNKSTNSKNFMGQREEDNDMVVLTKITEEDGYLPTIQQTEEDVIDNSPTTRPIQIFQDQKNDYSESIFQPKLIVGAVQKNNDDEMIQDISVPDSPTDLPPPNNKLSLFTKSGRPNSRERLHSLDNTPERQDRNIEYTVKEVSQVSQSHENNVLFGQTQDDTDPTLNEDIMNSMGKFNAESADKLNKTTDLQQGKSIKKSRLIDFSKLSLTKKKPKDIQNQFSVVDTVTKSKLISRLKFANKTPQKMNKSMDLLNNPLNESVDTKNESFLIQDTAKEQLDLQPEEPDSAIRLFKQASTDYKDDILKPIIQNKSAPPVVIMNMQMNEQIAPNSKDQDDQYGQEPSSGISIAEKTVTETTMKEKSLENKKKRLSARGKPPAPSLSYRNRDNSDSKKNSANGSNVVLRASKTTKTSQESKKIEEEIKANTKTTKQTKSTKNLMTKEAGDDEASKLNEKIKMLQAELRATTEDSMLEKKINDSLRKDNIKFQDENKQIQKKNDDLESKVIVLEKTLTQATTQSLVNNSMIESTKRTNQLESDLNESVKLQREQYDQLQKDKDLMKKAKLKIKQLLEINVKLSGQYEATKSDEIDAQMSKFINEEYPSRDQLAKLFKREAKGQYVYDNNTRVKIIQGKGSLVVILANGKNMNIKDFILQSQTYESEFLETLPDIQEDKRSNLVQINCMTSPKTPLVAQRMKSLRSSSVKKVSYAGQTIQQQRSLSNFNLKF